MLNKFYDKFIFANALKYKNGNFSLANLPFLICPIELMTALLETNDPEFEKKLYLAARESVARHLIPELDKEFGFKGEKMVDFFEKFFEASGWGKLKNVDLDLQAKKAIVNVSNNPVTANLRKKATRPADHLLRGIIAGVFSRVFHEWVDCVETHCAALGEQDCEFIVKKQHEFDYSDKRVRQQLELSV